MKKNLQKMTGISMAFVMIFSLAACAQVGEKQPEQPDGAIENGATIGTGAKTFTVEVTDADGKVTSFTVKSDEKTVGAALLALNVIAGDESQYGLYVKTVNGITADEANQEWWCLTKGGEAVMTGVDTTPVEDGAAYEFTLTVGW